MTAQTPRLDFAERAKTYADKILRASGSGLHNYSMARTRTAILLAALDGYEEAFHAGAAYATEKLRQPTSSAVDDSEGLGAVVKQEGVEL